MNKVKNGVIDSNEKRKKERKKIMFASLSKQEEDFLKIIERVPTALRTWYIEKEEKNIQKIKDGFRVKKKLEVPTGEELYLAAICRDSYVKYIYSYSGIKKDDSARHAVLVKKNLDGSFVFYDPNYGAVFNLTEEELCKVIAESFYTYATSNRLAIAASDVVGILIIAGIVTGIFAAIYKYNTIATALIIISLICLPVLPYLKENFNIPHCDIISSDIVWLIFDDLAKAEWQKLEKELEKMSSLVSKKLEDIDVTNGVQVENEASKMLSGA